MTRVVSVGRSKSLLAAGALGLGLMTITLVGCPGTLDPSAFPSPTSGSAGAGNTTGAAGAGNSSGTAGATSGTAGMVATAGTGGGLPAGCDPVNLLTVKYNCTTMTVCHDANGGAARLSMLQSNWPNLVNKVPTAGTATGVLTASICANDAKYKTVPYIKKGDPNGDGLIMQKLAGAICSPGGGQMPTIPGPIDTTTAAGAADMACIKAWATQLANAP